MSDQNNYICRCEDVTVEDLNRLIDEGYHTIEELKRLCRCTMGSCQGRTCRENLAWQIAKKTGLDIAEIDIPTYRAPVKPIKLGALFETRDEDEE